MSAEAGDGGIEVAAFVARMTKVFEDFVGTALTEALRRYPGVIRLQYSDHLDECLPGEEAAIPMLVDIVHSVSGRQRLVLDAEYKAAGPRDTNHYADHYQMLAYCTALRVPTAWLVYAGGGPEKARRIRHAGIEMVEYPLDLQSEPREVLEQFDLLARRAWERQGTSIGAQAS